MYFHIKNREAAGVKSDPRPGVGAYSRDNPSYRRAFDEMTEKISGMRPRDMAMMRRLELKKMRFQGKKPELVAKAAAIRMAITEEVNR